MSSALSMKHLIVGIALVMLAGHPAAAESVQLEESDGVYMVPVRINNTITIPFVLDSGAGDISVPAASSKVPRRSPSPVTR
jgi:hypothetical protein